MHSLKSLAIEALTWSQARASIQSVNPELAAQIDQLDPNPNYKLYRVKYRYGDSIVNDGVLHLPTRDGKLVAVRPEMIGQKLYDELGPGDRMLPGIMLHNNIELLIANKTHPVPILTFKTGDMFGFSAVFYLLKRNWIMKDIWHITAGARSLIMLPKITDTSCLLRLRKEFNICTPSVNTLSHQWLLFTELANHPDFPEPWSTELIFFSSAWMKHLYDPAWVHFFNYILLEYWRRNDFYANQWAFDFFFSHIQRKYNLKPNPYLVDTAKHIFKLGIGNTPGMSIATDNSAAPIHALQKIFIDSYGLKDYAPIMMHSKYFDIGKPSAPIYDSLQMPTTMAFSPKSRRVLSNVVGLQEIKDIMDKFIHETVTGSYTQSEACNMRYFVEKLSFKYFHSDENLHCDITHSSDLPKYDTQLAAELNRFPDRIFPKSAPFWRGCVQINKLIT